MAKRLMVISLVAVAVAMFLVTCFFGVLLIAPGFRAFGVMYVLKGTRVTDSGKIDILDEMDKLGYDRFTGSIVLETSEIPVFVEFTESMGHYIIEYHEDYSGFTKTDMDKPQMTISRDQKGSAVIKITSFESWMFKNANTERFIKLYIPLLNVGHNSGFAKTSLTIISKDSDITFSKEDDTDARIPSFETIDIKTNGKIESTCLVQTNEYKVESDNSIIIKDTHENTIYGSDHVLISNKGRVTVERPLAGSLYASTKNYDIKLVSCINLTAKSEYGDISCFDSDKTITVQGHVNIETKAGDVNLGVVGGYGENVITTSSGRVNIQKINKAKITTKRGSITAKSVGNATIETNMGKVQVEEALTKIDVKTKRGNVVLGNEGMIVNNPTVYSRLGRVKILSSSNSVKVETYKGNVEFINRDSTNINIICGGKLTAKKLTGKVDISVAKDAIIEFSTITNTSKIIAGDKCNSIVISAFNNSIDDTRYVLNGKLATRYIDNDNGTGTYSKMESSTSLTNSISSDAFLDVEGKNANIDFYCKLAPSENE